MPIQTPQQAPGSLAFNGTTLDFDRDPVTGFLVKRHWVDAAAFYLIRIRKGSVRSAPNQGETVTKIRTINKLTIDREVQDCVLSAYTDLLAMGVLRIESIDVDTSHRGAILYQVNYVNLITGRPNTTPKVAFAP